MGALGDSGLMNEKEGFIISPAIVPEWVFPKWLKCTPYPRWKVPIILIIRYMGIENPFSIDKGKGVGNSYFLGKYYVFSMLLSWCHLSFTEALPAPAPPPPPHCQVASKFQMGGAQKWGLLYICFSQKKKKKKDTFPRNCTCPIALLYSTVSAI